MFPTRNGLTVDFENQHIILNDQKYTATDLMRLNNRYIRFAKAEYILQTHENLSKQEAWEIAGITREIESKYDMPENKAIEEAIYQFEHGTVQKNPEDISTSKYSDVVDFDDPSIFLDGHKYSVYEAITLHNLSTQFTIAKTVSEVYKEYSEPEVWEIAGIALDKFSKNATAVVDAIPYGIYNGVIKKAVKDFKNSKIQELVEAGEWDIIEEGFKKFQLGEKVDNTLYFGKVDYGNHSFNFYIDAPSNEGIYVQFVPEYNIVDEVQYKTLGQLEDKKFVFPFQEDEEYELESFLQYVVAYDPTSHDSGGVLPCKEENLTDLETFKSSVVQKLLEDEMITRDVERYMFLKENGKCFHQQYEKARDNYLADIAREDKLSPKAVEGLAVFYRNEYYNFEDIPGSVEKIVSKMNEAGFSDARIKLMFSGMPKSVQEEMFKALGPAMKKLHNQEIGHSSPRAK